VKGTTTIACHCRPTWLSSGTLLFRSKLNYPNTLANLVAQKRRQKNTTKTKKFEKRILKGLLDQSPPTEKKKMNK
jgi:hypothetical protein